MELHACCSWLFNIRLFNSGCGWHCRYRPVISHSCSIGERFGDLAGQEEAFQIKSVPDELKAEILLNILGERVNDLLTYVSQEDLSNYVKIKELILREFEPTPQECLSNFKKARKLPSENYVQFASRLSATFDYYCQLRKVNEFRCLCDLIISDKIFETLDRDTMNHIATKQGETYFTSLSSLGGNVMSIYPREERFRMI
ncbi:integrase catalytic domain-containing protein [Trichonephila clavipes]|nr:integrase catalytic domain-containing protein [Trichonephila clavipes]